MKLRNGKTYKTKTIRHTSTSARIQKHPRKKRLGFREISWDWSEFRKNAQFCDGVILCEDGIEIKTHRVILSSVSSYFKAHFANCLNRGAPENTTAKVNVPSHIFTKLLDYAYTGQCTIDEDNVELILQAADQYHLLGVIQLCCRYLLDRLQPTNCLGILRLARRYFCSDLERESKRCVMHNFVKLLKEGDEFDNLTVEEVVEVLEDDELNVRDEACVFDAVRRWIGLAPRERKVHLLRLVKLVRLGRLSPEFLTENVMTWSLVIENKVCRNYLMGVEDEVVDIDNALWRPRVPYDILFAIGGQSAGWTTNVIETYDSRADRWLLSVDAEHIPRAYHGACALNGRIYMIGGFDGNEHLDTVRCFDPINHKWAECACMHYRRCFVSVAMHDNKIYALGGYNGRMRMRSAERYDPRCNHWELIKPMPRPRSKASAAVLNDKIYIVGGVSGNEVTSSAEVYNILADQWTSIPHISSARSGMSLVAFKGTLYALGGFNGSNRLATAEKFTPGVSLGWTPIKDMSSPRRYFATVVLDGLIFVIGGNKAINYVECYDTDSNEWTAVSPMHVNRSALSACILSGLPNARDFL